MGTCKDPASSWSSRVSLSQKTSLRLSRFYTDQDHDLLLKLIFPNLWNILRADTVLPLDDLGCLALNFLSTYPNIVLGVRP